MRFTRRVFLLSAASILLTSCSVIQSQSTASQNTNQPRLVVGLALGGGASKGFAHIGVLKVLRENNIPVHVVTGTSAGALVGSLYASGMHVYKPKHRC